MSSYTIPSRDRLLALQLLLELGIQLGSLHCILQSIHVLLELWDAEEAEQVRTLIKLLCSTSVFITNVRKYIC